MRDDNKYYARKGYPSILCQMNKGDHFRFSKRGQVWRVILKTRKGGIALNQVMQVQNGKGNIRTYHSGHKTWLKDVFKVETDES